MAERALYWRGVAAIGMAVAIIVGAVVFRWSPAPKPAEQVVAERPVSYWVDGADPKLTAAVTAYIKQTGRQASAGSAATAMIKLSHTKTEDAVAVSWGTGSPVALASSALVAPATYYVSGEASLVTDLVSELKTDTWTMHVVGDIGLGRSVYNKMRQYKDTAHPFSAFAPAFRADDLTLANLETAVSDSRAVITDSGMTFVAPVAATASLKSSGIDAVSVANNHSYNGGAAGFIDTLEALKLRGVAVFGGGRTDAKAHAPLIQTVKGIKVGLLGYSAITGSVAATASQPGMAYMTMAPWGKLNESQIKRLEADIKAAKTQADVVFVYFHWGTEYTHVANADQRTVAHRAIDAGADLVLGAHPHWVQGVEWYRDHLIAYSLGNFVFDQDWSAKTSQGTMLKATFNGRQLVGAELVPYQIKDNHRPEPASASVAATILRDVYSHSWWPVP